MDGLDLGGQHDRETYSGAGRVHPLDEFVEADVEQEMFGWQQRLVREMVKEFCLG